MTHTSNNMQPIAIPINNFQENIASVTFSLLNLTRADNYYN